MLRYLTLIYSHTEVMLDGTRYFMTYGQLITHHVWFQETIIIAFMRPLAWMEDTPALEVYLFYLAHGWTQYLLLSLSDSAKLGLLCLVCRSTSRCRLSRLIIERVLHAPIAMRQEFLSTEMHRFPKRHHNNPPAVFLVCSSGNKMAAIKWTCGGSNWSQLVTGSNRLCIAALVALLLHSIHYFSSFWSPL